MIVVLKVKGQIHKDEVVIALVDSGYRVAVTEVKAPSTFGVASWNIIISDVHEEDK